jgi:predicted DNA-binding transcriptional regulator AlpA
MPAPMTFIYETSVRRLEQIVQLLEENPQGLTRMQLAAFTEIGAAAIYSYLKKLHSAPRRVRVGAWNRQLGRQGNFEPVYFAGIDPDEPKPAPLTPAERGRRYRQSLRSTSRKVQPRG